MQKHPLNPAYFAGLRDGDLVASPKACLSRLQVIALALAILSVPIAGEYALAKLPEWSAPEVVE